MKRRRRKKWSIKTENAAETSVFLIKSPYHVLLSLPLVVVVEFVYVLVVVIVLCVKVRLELNIVYFVVVL